jgi:epoxyqueuosine reductase
MGASAEMDKLTEDQCRNLAARIKAHAAALGFSQIGIAGVDLGAAEQRLERWLQAGMHGGMHYMAAHGRKRSRPAELVPGTLRVISVALDYLHPVAPDWRTAERARLTEPGAAVVSIYARGRDYHRLLRQRLQRLAERIAADIGPFGHRVFVDSAPVMEVALAQQAGLGWVGKHTLLLRRDGGSTMFLGELFVDLPLPVDAPVAAHCGRCERCIEICPTRAIVAPYVLDARRCISYLTIEHDGPIPLELRRAIGQHVYGCDDCQTVCPWNKYARRSAEPDFAPRHGLEHARLVQLWGWSAADFDERLAGSAMRRIGYRRWRRNLAVASGNALAMRDDPALRACLQAARALHADDALLAEHLHWALAQQPRETT